MSSKKLCPRVSHARLKNINPLSNWTSSLFFFLRFDLAAFRSQCLSNVVGIEAKTRWSRLCPKCRQSWICFPFVLCLYRISNGVHEDPQATLIWAFYRSFLDIQWKCAHGYTYDRETRKLPVFSEPGWPQEQGSKRSRLRILFLHHHRRTGMLVITLLFSVLVALSEVTSVTTPVGIQEHLDIHIDQH